MKTLWFKLGRNLHTMAAALLILTLLPVLLMEVQVITILTGIFVQLMP